MLNVVVLMLAILATVFAAVAAYAAVKRRLPLMSVSMTLMLAFLGAEQWLACEPRWLAYLSFSVATLGAISILVRRWRGQRT